MVSYSSLSPGRRRFGLSSLAAGAGRATPPPVRPSKHGHTTHGHSFRPPKSNFNLFFGMIIAVSAVSLVAILALVGRESPPTMSELRQELGLRTIPHELDQVDFVNRLDRIGSSRQGEVVQGAKLYLFYKVREGQAMIELDRMAWEAQKARITQVVLR